MAEDARARRQGDRDRGRLNPVEVLGHYDRLIKGTQTAAEPIACLVCLVVRPGEEPKVVMDGSSGNSEVDRMATEALARASRRWPLDPDVKPQRSCYRFSVTISRIPPLPMVGCGFDEATLTGGCYYPTMKVTKTDVHLESVDYGG